MSSWSTFTVDGVPLDGTHHWVNETQRLHGPSAITMASVTLPGRPGELAIPGTRQHGASDWVLSMTIRGDSYAGFLAIKAAVEARLSPVARMVTIRETFPSGDWLEATGYLSSADQATMWDSYETGADFNYTFRIPSGVWYGPEVGVVLPTTGVFTLEHMIGSSAPCHDTRVEIAGTAGSYVQISAAEDSGAAIAFQGDPGLGTTIWPDAVLSTDANGVNNSVNLRTNSRVFYVPAGGQVRVDNRSGISSLTLFSRKAVY